MDLLARRKKDGRFILYDWKTREAKRYDGYQLAGYLGLAALHPEIPFRTEDLEKTDRVSSFRSASGRKLVSDPTTILMILRFSGQRASSGTQGRT